MDAIDPREQRLQMLEELARLKAERAADAAAPAAPAAAPAQEPGFLAKFLSSVLTPSKAHVPFTNTDVTVPGVQSVLPLAAQQALEVNRFNPLKPTHWAGAGKEALEGLRDDLLGLQQRKAEMAGDTQAQAQLEQQALARRAQQHQQVSTVPGAAGARLLGRAAPAAIASFIPGAQGLAGAAVLGGLTGYVEPTVGNESPGWNAAKSAALSMVVPAGLKAYGAYQKYLTPEGALQRAASDMVDQLVPKDAPAATRQQAISDALDQLRTKAGLPAASTAPEVPKTFQELFGASPPGQAAAQQGAQQTSRGIPLTVAQITRDPKLIRSEQVNRLKNPEGWINYDVAQQEALGSSVHEATKEATQLSARQGAASTAYEQGKAAAAAAADPQVFASERANLRQRLNDLMQSPEAMANDDIKGMYSKLANAIDELGDNWTPEHLIEVRKALSGKQLTASANPFAKAPRGAKSTIDLKQALDSALDSATGGQWSPINAAYKQAQQGVRQSEAAQAVRNVFWDPETGKPITIATGDLTGDVPQVTAGPLLRAIKATRMGKQQISQLSPDARQGLAETLKALRAMQAIQKLNRSATGGGGSATASNITGLVQDAGVDYALGKIPGVTGAVVRGGKGLIGNLVNARTNAATTQALQQAPDLAQLLLQKGVPLTNAERAALTRLAVTTGVGLGDKLPQEP